MLNIIIDTNVIISGLLGSRKCRPIYLAFKNHSFNLILSPFIFEEIAEVIRRPKFKNRINQDEINDTIIFIEQNAYFVKPSKKLLVCRDIEDNPFLECALEATKYFNNLSIVSDDKDLLVLSPFENIPIIPSLNFLKILKQQ